MEDYRKMASMAQFMVAVEELPLTGGYLQGLLQHKTRVANEELGIFLKLLNRKTRRSWHWLKPE
jgi:hypothetical protein